VERFADAKVVLLGEATHGTAEFYQARARITEMLVDRHGFNIVAAEADWPDAAVYDAYVRGLPRPKVPAAAFTRFPTWMWRNGQVTEFLDRLKEINATFPDPERKCGFYGLDIYSLGASIEAVLAYLDKVDPEAAKVARERYGCLTPWRAEPAAYGRMARSRGFAICEKPVTDTLVDLLKRRLDYLTRDGEAFFDAVQNARIVAGAEQYYRAIYYGSAASWNVRDQHMFDTLEQILAERGPEAKAVVWAHNSHIGNAAFTEMGQVKAARATPASRPSCWSWARDSGTRCARRWPSRSCSAPSASSTGPRPNCCRTISRQSCHANSTPGSGSRRLRPSRRDRAARRRARTRPIPSGFRNLDCGKLATVLEISGPPRSTNACQPFPPQFSAFPSMLPST
jgi:hypothetical protein